MINFEKFNWQEIFGTIVATDGLKRNQLRGLRTEIQEMSTAKWSDNQLEYVGFREDGKDFVDCNSEDWECKGAQRMFLKKRPYTTKIVLKNFRNMRKNQIEKTFDYMLLFDTVQMMAAYTTWDAVYKNIEINDAVVQTRADQDDLIFIAKDIIPKNKSDFSSILNELIKEII